MGNYYDGDDWQDAMAEADWDFHQQKAEKLAASIWDSFGSVQQSRVPTLNALEKEQLLIWEHELNQPNYYDYFLEEVTR